MSRVAQRLSVMEMIGEAVKGGARRARAYALRGFSERTLQRWQGEDSAGVDGRSLRHPAPAHK